MDELLSTWATQRSRSRVPLRLLLVGFAVLSGTSTTWAQAQPDPLPSPLPETSTDAQDAKTTEPIPVEYAGTVLPGKRINLSLQGVEAPGSRYEWTQVEGPPVVIDHPEEPRISLVVPAEARRLAFILAVWDARGQSRRYRVNVPVRALEVPAAETDESGDPAYRAEAGDDQIGLVGRRMTLDGSRSLPAEGLLYRWLQIDGPEVGEARQDGPYFSFRPQAAGVHRFALVVAGEGAISEPDFVTVTVGELPGTSAKAASAASSRTEPVDLGLALIAVGASLAPRSPALLEPLAEAFDRAAAQCAGPVSFAAVQSELAQRCDAIIPSDPASRSQWNRLVLEPLTQYTVAHLAPIGLDARMPASLQGPLSPAQQDRLGLLYRSIARALRDLAPSDR